MVYHTRCTWLSSLSKNKLPLFRDHIATINDKKWIFLCYSRFHSSEEMWNLELIQTFSAVDLICPPFLAWESAKPSFVFRLFFQATIAEWLQLLNLEQYCNCLTQQGYQEIDDVTDITWEDLEEIGISLLGKPARYVLNRQNTANLAFHRHLAIH